MGEYLKIKGDPATVIASASQIVGAAESLQSELPSLLHSIASLETDAVIGRDELATSFTKTYRQPTPTGTGTATATDATKQAATSIAGDGSAYGNAVVTAMEDYLLTDGASSADIANTRD